MKERKPIFYDAEKVRWRFTRRTLEVSGALLTLLLVYFFITVAGSVELPSSLLPDTRPSYHAAKKKTQKPVTLREGRHLRVSRIGQVPEGYDPLRAAFFVSWDANSLASLKKHYKDLDLLMPEQLHSVTPDGAITVVDYEHNQQTVEVTPSEAIARLKQDKLHQWMRSMNPPIELPMMGLLNNYDGVVWRVKEMEEMLADPAARHRLVTDVAAYAVEAHQSGIVVDFEEIPIKSQPHFREFIAELAPALHQNSLKLMIALPARDDDYDYAFFGRETDAIILMNYDQHWLTSPPGPIAAQDWFMENLRQIRDVVPAQKIVVGIANYAYDWTESAKKDARRGEEFSIQEALLHAHESEVDVDFDAASLNPHYSYEDEQNRTHQVWMLDAVTAYNQLRACERLGVQGTALWRLGSADTSIWPIWDAIHPDDATREKLQELPPGPDLILEGAGDIWRIIDVPKPGRRSFSYDAGSDLITSEKYEAIPLSYDIDQIGAAKNKIVISFDDGPDRRWTPRILDVLKEKHAPAVFFVVGEQANASPDLLKREYNEGHEIGNHTFTHPQFDEISHTQLKWELNLTQRLIESTLGVKSLLFRPPYGIDHQPEYAEEVVQLPYPQELGYIIVGQKIDPDDWRVDGSKPQRPAEEIAEEVLRQAKNGNIVLLHDGGGDRAQTVAALPLIIDRLRANGYELTSVSDLLGKNRAGVMVPLTFREWLGARADGLIFGIFQWFRYAIATVFILGIFLVSGRALIIGILAIIEKLRPDHAKLSDPPPAVTVLIPAHNEESVIVQTVTSVLLSDLTDIHVIIVDDGSSDKTLELLQSNFGRNEAVQIIHQVNRGKAAALNNAMSQATTEIVVTIDADTEIESDALSKLLRHFSDPTVGAVAGNVKVGNRSRWLTRWQALEYITSQNMEKRAFDLLNCITVVPGALGAWRKKAIEDAGGITADTVAEDADLTIAIRRLGWRVTYDEEAIAWTEAPETPGALIRQRFRWTFGTLQSFWKHNSTLFRPKYGTLGWIALPNIFIFQIALPLISPLLDLLFFGSLLLWGLAQLHITQIPQLWTSADVQRSVVFFLGFLIIDVLTCVIAFALERHEDWTLLIPVLLQRFYYRQLMYIVLFRSVKEAVSGRPVGWRGVEHEPPRPSPEPATS
jgi:cellulose synthase/poly-beta-1,6-N-acetylglucosamine synthase-like glycosyltransferase/spore germination protein YaaH/peptidoglycan/xylan/chitin deacetylase (PgdA/CDA1 family)